MRRRRPAIPVTDRRAERAAVEDPDVVMAAAARFLEGRARSIDEVRRRLAQAGYRPELVDEVIGRLERLGILDDDGFARAWVESRDRAHPRGTRVLREELRRKGVAADVIAAVLAERAVAPSPDDPTAAPEPDDHAADRLLARHVAALGRVTDPRQRRQRAYALLARNGFDPDTASAAVRRAEAAAAAVESSDEDDAPAGA